MKKMYNTELIDNINEIRCKMSKSLTRKEKRELKKQFPLTKEEIEMVKRKKKQKIENVIVNIIILFQITFLIAIIIVLYLMVTYQW